MKRPTIDPLIIDAAPGIPEKNVPPFSAYDRAYDDQVLWANADKRKYRMLALGGLPLFKALHSRQTKSETPLNPDRLAEAKEAEAWAKQGDGVNPAYVSNRSRFYDRDQLPPLSKEEAVFRAELRKELNGYVVSMHATEVADVIPIAVAIPPTPAQEVPVQHSEVA